MAYASGVLFDVDGTLVDTTYLHTTNWWQAFQQFGHRVPLAAIHQTIGMGADKIVERLLPPERDRDVDAKIAGAHEALQATYWDRLQPLPGAADLLRGCHAAGVRVVLASSATGRELEALRRTLDADDVIDASVGLEEGGRSKPDPDILEAALRETGLKAEEVVAVGDSLWDIHAASRLNIPCIALKSGGTCESALRDAGAVEVYRDPEALLEALDQSAVARRM